MAQYKRSVSPLDSADFAFRALTEGPAPLALDGRYISTELPQRRIPLDELKRVLLRPSTGPAARDAAWAQLVWRARRRGPSWVVGAVGVALPGLRRAAGRLTRGYRGDTADIDAEVLTGFLAALRTIDVAQPAIALRLCWAGRPGPRQAPLRGGGVRRPARRASVACGASPALGASGLRARRRRGQEGDHSRAGGADRPHPAGRPGAERRRTRTSHQLFGGKDAQVARRTAAC